MTEIRQVTVKGHRIGIAGLDEVFEEVRSLEFASDEDLAGALVDLVSARNYVPESSREDYKRALLREFKIAQGERWKSSVTDSMPNCTHRKTALRFPGSQFYFPDGYGRNMHAG